MSVKPKTRFAVRYNGRLKEILSVRESSQGELRILPKTERFRAEITSGGILYPVRVNRSHISVHSTPKSAGTLIKFTQTRADVEEHSAAQFVTDGKAALRNVLFAKLCPLLTSRYDLKSGPRDDVREVGEFSSTDNACLIYTVVVTNVRNQIHIPDGHAVTWAEFRHWMVCVYTTYCNLPQRPFGSMRVVSTAPPRVNGIALEGGGVVQATALTPDALKDEVMNIGMACAERHRVRLVQQQIDLPLRLRLKRHEIWFHSTPASLSRGRLKRHEEVFV